MEITLCSPQDTFVIVERVYVTLTSPVGGKVLPSIRKVVRHVASTCAVQDVYYNGTRQDGMANGFQLLMDALGLASLTTRPTGDQRLLLVYAGFDDLITVLPPDLHIPPLPESIFREYRLPRVGLYQYGHDPIPEVRLFGNPQVQFISPGGEQAPVAMALYHGSTQSLEPVPPAVQQQTLSQLGG